MKKNLRKVLKRLYSALFFLSTIITAYSAYMTYTTNEFMNSKWFIDLSVDNSQKALDIIVMYSRYKSVLVYSVAVFILLLTIGLLYRYMSKRKVGEINTQSSNEIGYSKNQENQKLSNGDIKFCTECGIGQESDAKFCRECGSAI